MIAEHARIAVVAPSGIYDPATLDTGLALARDAGFDLTPVGDLRQPDRFLCAPDHVRLAHLVDALTHDVWDAVWLARGGYGLTRLLDDVPWDDVRARTVIGFSDATPLLEAMRVRTHAVGIHGPVLHSLPKTKPEHRQHLWDLLAGRPTAPIVGEAWASGDAYGPIVGGNLSMLAATCGTPWQVDATGALLLLEDIGEMPYRVDRMLTQLRQAGLFRDVAGVLVGTWEGCRAPDGADWSVTDVVRDALAGLGVPVLGGLPIGHGADNLAVPIGLKARIEDGALAWG